MQRRFGPHSVVSQPALFVLTGALCMGLPLMFSGCESGGERERASLSPEDQERQRTLDALKLRAESGDVATMLELAARFYDGNGVEASRSKAASWFRMAAEAGNTSAQFSTGVLYEQGHGLAPDLEQAVYWYGKAAEQQHPQAMNNLGILLMEEQTPESDERAFQLFQSAAESDILSSICALGRLKSAGRGTSQDYVGAAKDFRQAADEGFAAAQFYLAAAYQKGHGVPLDETQALRWLETSAEQGFPLAQAQLGSMFARGTEVTPKDPARAVALLTAAANERVPSAQRNLGLLYFKGLGVDEDREAALMWYEISASYGDQAAKERRDLLRETMAESELANVAASVDAWFDEHPDRVENDPLK